MDMSIWFLVGAAMVFFMQCGFAMVETGFTRAKNAGNIIMKNMMDFCIGTVAFLLIGYTLLCGKDINGFVGWGLNPFSDFTKIDWSGFVFNLVFCATAATIVSGAMAERTKFASYCVYSFIISLVIYPVEAHWVWGGGWLSQLGYIDFAGSSAIHMVGGVTALIGAAIEGARIGKFDKDGKPRAILGHSLTLGALGVFILWFAWYGFNGAAASDVNDMARIFVTTTIAPAVATCTVMLVTWKLYNKPDISLTLNGSLAGLVAITAGCDNVDIYGSIAIGVVSGFVVIFFVWFLDNVLRVDDPVGAVAVHFGNGLWGTLAVGLFDYRNGLFYGGGFHLLGIQALGVVSILAWTALTMFIVFKLIDKTIGLRVSPQEEIIGLDKEEHGLDSSYSGFVFETEYAAGQTLTNNNVTPEMVIPVEHVESKKIIKDKMTKIDIVTKTEKFDALKDELNRIGIQGMTLSKVLGCGVQKGKTTYYRGAQVDMQLLPKMKAEIIVSKIPVETVIEAARKVLYTGAMGDGKIFVYDVENVIRISNGDQGVDALQNYD